MIAVDTKSHLDVRGTRAYGDAAPLAPQNPQGKCEKRPYGALIDDWQALFAAIVIDFHRGSAEFTPRTLVSVNSIRESSSSASSRKEGKLFRIAREPHASECLRRNNPEINKPSLMLSATGALEQRNPLFSYARLRPIDPANELRV